MSEFQDPRELSDDARATAMAAERKRHRPALLAFWGIAAIVTLAHGWRVFTIPERSLAEVGLLSATALIPRIVAENPLSLLTHMLVHTGWLHLGMNVALFVMLAAPLALRAGPGLAGAARIVLLTLLSGLGGAAGVIALDPQSKTAVVGFSGAVCGAAAAFLLSQRETWREALTDRRILMQGAVFLLLAVGVPAANDGLKIAWEMHLGGFFTGLAAWIVLAPRPPHRPASEGHEAALQGHDGRPGPWG